jgi:hypothetical protein
MPEEEVAVSGDGTPTGALAEHGEAMAAGVAVAALGGGDRNNAESDLRVKIKIVFFLCFFLTCCRMRLYVNLRTVFFLFFFFNMPSWQQAIKKRGFTSRPEKVFSSNELLNNALQRFYRALPSLVFSVLSFCLFGSFN